VFQPLQRPSLYEERKNMNSTQSEKWALNTDKYCSTEKYLPRLQQFKEYNFPKRNDSDIHVYQNTFLKSDNIALRNIEPTRKFEYDTEIKSENKLSLSKTMQDFNLSSGNKQSKCNKITIII
jgi:hypothetical protein